MSPPLDRGFIFLEFTLITAFFSVELLLRSLGQFFQLSKKILPQRELEVWKWP